MLLLRCRGFLETWRHVASHYFAVREFARRKCIEGGFHGDKMTVRPNFVSPDPGEWAGAGGYIQLMGVVQKLLDEERGRK